MFCFFICVDFLPAKKGVKSRDSVSLIKKPFLLGKCAEDSATTFQTPKMTGPQENSPPRPTGWQAD